MEAGYLLENFDNQPLKDYEWVLFFEAENVRSTFQQKFTKYLKSKIKGRSIPRDLYGECIRAKMEQQIALFLWEPPSVSPENYDPQLHKLFPLIFTWHDDYVDGHKFIKIHIPQPRQFPEVPKIPFSQKKLLVNISMNKDSSHPRELYSARRDAIRYFERKYPENFDLFGFMWDKPRTLLERCVPWMRQAYPSYRGIAKNKWDIMPYYRFSICYENLLGEPGYVTRKVLTVCDADVCQFTGVLLIYMTM